MTRTAFITGATAGIGAATARRLVTDGWQVVGTGRRVDRLQELADELGEAFRPLVLDMRDLGAIAEAVATVATPIDLLVNNAGLAPPMDALQDAELGALTNAIDTNVTGLVALTRALLPRLIERRGAVSICRRLRRPTLIAAARSMPRPRPSSASSASICAATSPGPGCG